MTIRESVPRAVATGSSLGGHGRRSGCDPVATARGTDLIAYGVLPDTVYRITISYSTARHESLEVVRFD